jgi:hypothetical protein
VYLGNLYRRDRAERGQRSEQRRAEGGLGKGKTWCFERITRKGHRVAYLGNLYRSDRAERAQRVGQRRAEGGLGKWESLVF